MATLIGSAEPARLRALVQSRAWDWLFALRRGFNVDLQVVDDQAVPFLREGGGSPSDLTDLLESRHPALAHAVQAAARTGVPQRADAEPLQCLCFALDRTRGSGGVLVVARHSRLSRGREERTHSELEVLARWLASAIDAHLVSPPAGAPDASQRASSLHRLLSPLAAGGSDRDLVARFAEAVAVWHDLDVAGYVEIADGFAREVLLPGAEPGRFPAVIARGLVPEDAAPLHLVRADPVRFGFAGGDDWWIVRLPAGSGRSWLLAVSGEAAGDQGHLLVYLVLLNAWLAQAVASARAAIARGLAALLQGGATPDDAAGEAIELLRRELRAASVSVVVRARTGLPVLRRVSHDSMARLTDTGAMATVARAVAGVHLELAAGFARGSHLSPQEQGVLDTAAHQVEAWLTRVGPELASRGERRGSGRAYETVLEQLAAHALQAGTPVSVAVFSGGHRPSTPDTTAESVVRLRSALRGTDIVGVLSDGAIGVLFQDTPRDRAQAVAGRLAVLLGQGGSGTNGHAAPVVGLAARGPGDSASGLVQEARDDGARGGGRGL